MHRIRSGARAHAAGRESPRNSSSVPPVSDEPTLQGQNVNEKRPEKRSRRKDTAIKSKSEKSHSSPPIESASSPSNSQAHGSSDPPSLEEPQPPDISSKPSLPTRFKNGSVRFWQHTKNAIFRSYINILLIFVPIGIAAECAHLKPEIVFAMNAIAIIPLAGLLTHATESVAVRLGDTLGALLNVSFGNAVELIIFIALVKNEIRIVQASLLGSILANLLLILGMAFACGGLRYQEQIYNSTVTQMSACLLSLSVMSLLLPTAFHASFQDTNLADYQTLRISRGVCVVLLLVYILYLIFQLKSHSYLYQSMPQERIDEESHPGLLADVFDSSTSSDSSSTDSSDTDTTSGSHTTVKRIKRAFRSRRRRRSVANSEETRSVPSALSSPPPELVSHGSDGSHPKERNRSNSLRAIASGDEADHEGLTPDISSVPKIRDFETSAEPSAMSPDRVSSPESKHRRHKRKHKKQQKKHKKAADKINNFDKEDVEAAMQVREPLHHVDFIDPETAPPGTAGSGTSKGKSGTHWRPGLPKLLSQNVFVDKPPVQQPQRPRLNRASSLPDLSRMSTVPGRGLRPSQLPLQPTQSKPKQVLISGEESEDEEAEHEPLQLSRTAAIVMLLVSTGLVAVCAEFLVDAIPALTASSSVSQTFIGLIILPIVGNAAEHVTAVTVAMKNKMDLSIGVAVGSSIQIALFVTPLVVLLGWCINRQMSLYFTIFETISLFVTAFVVNFLVLDGRSNYLEGALLIASYIIIAVAAFFYPDSASASEVGGGDTRNSTVNATTAAASLMIRAFVA